VKRWDVTPNDSRFVAYNANFLLRHVRHRETSRRQIGTIMAGRRNVALCGDIYTLFIPDHDNHASMRIVDDVENTRGRSRSSARAGSSIRKFDTAVNNPCETTSVSGRAPADAFSIMQWKCTGFCGLWSAVALVSDRRLRKAPGRFARPYTGWRDISTSV